jgi:hypothetical protein
LIVRAAHVTGYIVGSRTSLYYWPVLGCRKFENAAEAILHGNPGTGPFVYASPLYRYLLLPFYFTGLDRTGLFIFQSLLGVLTAWFIFNISMRTGAGKWAAFTASVCWSLYSPVLFFELTILPVSMLTALIAFFLLLQLQSNKTGPASLSGFAGGIIAGLRPPFILLMALPFWTWIKNRSVKNLAAAGLFLLIPLLFLSFQQRNLGGGFYPFPRTAGCNLVLGHSSESSGYGPPVPSEGLVETGSGDIHDVAAALTSEMGISSPEQADRYWMKIALTWIAGHPVEELRLIAVKLGGFFGSKPFDVYYELGRISSFNPVFRFVGIPRLLIPLLFLTGLIPFCIMGKHRTLVVAPIAISLGSSILFVHSERFFLPALPAMMAVAAAGISILLKMFRDNPIKWLSASAAGLLLLIPAIFYPVPAVPEEMYISSLAVRAYLMEDFDLSLELFERAALLADEGSVIWVQGHTEAARISEALGYSARSNQHSVILRNWELGQ